MSMIGVLRSFQDDSFLTIDLDVDEFESLPAFVLAIDVDKAWHALSAITAPGPDPLHGIEHPDPLDPILGGREFGDDLGYGAARHLDPEQVRAVHVHLEALTDEQARARFDPAAFTEAGVYPSMWDEADIWEADLAPNLHELRAFYAAAARAGEHVVLSLE